MIGNKQESVFNYTGIIKHGIELKWNVDETAAYIWKWDKNTDGDDEEKPSRGW